jgi:hypothetical protein
MTKPKDETCTVANPQAAESKNGNGNGEPDFDRKTELFTVSKKAGVSIVITLMEKRENAYIDIRERVDNPKGDWNGWTRKGITMPISAFAEIADKARGALAPHRQ